MKKNLSSTGSKKLLLQKKTIVRFDIQIIGLIKDRLELSTLPFMGLSTSILDTIATKPVL